MEIPLLLTAALNIGFGSGSSVIIHTFIHSLFVFDFRKAFITACTYSPSSKVAASATGSFTQPRLSSTGRKASLRAPIILNNPFIYGLGMVFAAIGLNDIDLCRSSTSK
uniref:Uncharacterized protein n=1 Tax=Panstrongylus lignarius TaxID=156445 RepID=A0A224Y2D4_9HEMI